MRLLNRFKTKKGFTLVEVIIVLVILAILAAILIPSLVGYIDKANEKASISECRSYILAAQTIASETYGEKGALTTTGTGATVVQNDFLAETLNLSELGSGITASTLNSADYLADVTLSGKGKVSKVALYIKKSNNLVTFDGSKYTVNTSPASTVMPKNTLTISG